MKKMTMPYSQATLVRKSTENNSKKGVDTEESMDTKHKKNNQNKGFKWKPDQKKMHSTKREYRGKGHKDMSRIKCYNCREYGHYACDSPKPCDNANIALRK